MLFFAQIFAQGTPPGLVAPPGAGMNVPVSIPDGAWGGGWPQFWIALSLCVATVIIVCAIFFMAYKGKEIPERMYRLLIIIVVLFIGSYLLVAGYNERQVAPMIGILGTILGYILGQASAIVGPAAQESRQSLNHS